MEALIHSALPFISEDGEREDAASFQRGITVPAVKRRMHNHGSRPDFIPVILLEKWVVGEEVFPSLNKCEIVISYSPMGNLSIMRTYPG